MNQQNALDKIAQANKSKATELNLSRLSLTALPPAIGTLTQLEKLCLFKNKLTTLPTEISNLTQLQNLDLYENNLTKEAVLQLTGLENLAYLDLEGNPALAADGWNKEYEDKDAVQAFLKQVQQELGQKQQEGQAMGLTQFNKDVKNLTEKAKQMNSGSNPVTVQDQIKNSRMPPKRNAPKQAYSITLGQNLPQISVEHGVITASVVGVQLDNVLANNQNSIEVSAPECNGLPLVLSEGRNAGANRNNALKLLEHYTKNTQQQATHCLEQAAVALLADVRQNANNTLPIFEALLQPITELLEIQKERTLEFVNRANHALDARKQLAKESSGTQELRFEDEFGQELDYTKIEAKTTSEASNTVPSFTLKPEDAAILGKQPNHLNAAITLLKGFTSEASFTQNSLPELIEQIQGFQKDIITEDARLYPAKKATWTTKAKPNEKSGSYAEAYQPVFDILQNLTAVDAGLSSNSMAVMLEQLTLQAQGKQRAGK